MNIGLGRENFNELDSPGCGINRYRHNFVGATSLATENDEPSSFQNLTNTGVDLRFSRQPSDWDATSDTRPSFGMSDSWQTEAPSLYHRNIGMPLKFASEAAEAYRYPLLIKHLFFTSITNAAEQEVVYKDQHRYSYVTLGKRVEKLACALSAVGVKQSSTVSIMDWDSHRYLESYFAVPMMGAVLHTVNVRLSEDQIVYTINHAGAQVLILHRDFLPLVRAAGARLTTVRTIIFIQDGEEVDLAGLQLAAEYEQMMDGVTGGFEFEDFDENAIATTLYTSGTTGLPKAVCFSHRQLVLHTLAATATFASSPSGQSFRRGDVYMPMTPMFHVHAWGIPYIATLLGVKQVYPGRYDPSSLIKLKEREGVTYSHCVPTILHMLLSTAEQTGLTGSCRGWKMTIGGAPLSRALAKRALDNGMDVFVGYGMSEACPILTIARLPAPCGNDDEAIDFRCKAGVPTPLVYTRIVDENMRVLPNDGKSVGELVVRAPWLTPEYVGDSNASDALWAGGYLHTQDIASIDAQGYVQISDRLKDVIKTGGEWVSSLLLENLISSCPHVSEVAVIGHVDVRWGERPVALAVKAPEVDAKVMEKQIQTHLNAFVLDGTISKYAVPDRIIFVDVLPKTSVGKLDKKALRAVFAAAI